MGKCGRTNPILTWRQLTGAAIGNPPRQGDQAPMASPPFRR